MTKFEKLTLKMLIVNSIIFILSVIIALRFIEEIVVCCIIEGAAKMLLWISVIIFIGCNKIESYLFDKIYNYQ